MNSKTRALFFICLGLLFGMSVMYIYNNFIADKKTVTSDTRPKYRAPDDLGYSSASQSIDRLTDEKTVSSYVKQHHRLPDFYLTKNEARKRGWNPSQGNLCDVLPGKAIGGDKFGNRERTLPIGPQYYEADVNYHCGNRNADRIVFSKNGDVYLTKNHYRSFEKQ